jgi:lipopolysaccharide transport system permease protein
MFLGNIDLMYYWDLLLVLTKKEIKVRYKNSYFGYFWSILNPLGFAFVFYFVFKIVMRIEMENYALFLVSGLFPWQWISNTTIGSTVSFVRNASIIKKVNFPRSILPFATVLQDMFHFCCAIPVILLFLIIYKQTPSINWLPGIPILMLITLAMVYGISLFLASLNLFFRDIEHIMPIVMMFLFYPTPILYPLKMLPENFQSLIILNPFAPIVIAWRNLFIKGSFEISYILVSIVYATIMFLVGALVYRKFRWKFAEVL